MPSKITVEQFHKVLELSGVLSTEQVGNALKQLAEQDIPCDDADSIAKGLVELNLLTPWQANRLLRGKHKGYELGKYRLLSRIGAGAMGAVYLAEHVVMRRRCAIKVLPSSRVGDASYLQRFIREAQAVAALNHPNIVRAYDVDHEIDGDREIHYLTMEFIDGADAQVVVAKGGPLDFVAAVDIVRQAAEGLSHAHAAGMVHRDIKPSNLLVDKQGVVKILDLGLAKAYADESEASVTMAHNETVLGTADYLSPEQALNSHDADYRSDIYSLGCTLYCLLTGHPPFNKGSVAQRLAAHQAKPPPRIQDERPETPEDLTAIVDKAMAKEMDDRYQSAKEMSEVLSEWLLKHAGAEWKQQHLARVAAGLESSLRAGGADTMASRAADESSLRDLSEPAVGIDLGTTFSVIAVLDKEGKPSTIPSEDGEGTTPSVVFFDDAAPLVGKEAVRAAEFEPDRVAMFAKRDVGESHFHKPICGEKLPPEVIESLVLRKLKEDASQTLGEFKKAVITVPAYFNEPRRKATQDAGRLAGLKVLDIINEPTAAAIAYGVQQGFVSLEGAAQKREVILVYDLGGGTFDVTLMEIDGSHFSAMATAGDVYLGGMDWDQRIADHVVEQFKAEHGIDLKDDSDAMERLLPIAADTKKSLSVRDSATLHFAHEGKRLRIRLARDQFEAMSADLLDRTRSTVNKLLREAKITWKEVTRLLLVGGSSRMPMVQKMLEKESGLVVDRSLNPDEAVAHGAAIYAGILLKKGIPAIEGISVRNVNSHALGILGVDPQTKRQRRKIMIPRNSKLPTKRSCAFPTNKPGQKSVLVSVVEGGTDSGANATKIGKCVVTDLPPDLPKNTPVKVVFQYAANGRLKVEAELPTIGKKAALTIQRASGLNDEELKEWKSRIREGRLLSASSIATSAPAAAPMVMTEIVETEHAEDELDLTVESEVFESESYVSEVHESAIEEDDELDLTLGEDDEIDELEPDDGVDKIELDGDGEALEPDEEIDELEPDDDDGLMPDMGDDEFGLVADDDVMGFIEDDGEDDSDLKELE